MRRAITTSRKFIIRRLTISVVAFGELTCSGHPQMPDIRETPNTKRAIPMPSRKVAKPAGMDNKLRESEPLNARKRAANAA